MLFFVDTADLSEISELAQSGFLDGVTTNPTLIAQAGGSFTKRLEDICALTKGPVSAEVTALDSETMVAQGQTLARIATNIIIKVPLTWPGLDACRKLSAMGIGVNVTLCFTPNQVLLAAKAGAAFASIFMGRLDDVGAPSAHVIELSQHILKNFNFSTKILAASIRSVDHVTKAAHLGAGAVTMPPKIFKALAHHPLTDRGIDIFTADWAAHITQSETDETQNFCFQL